MFLCHKSSSSQTLINIFLDGIFKAISLTCARKVHAICKNVPSSGKQFTDALVRLNCLFPIQWIKSKFTYDACDISFEQNLLSFEQYLQACISAEL